MKKQLEIIIHLWRQVSFVALILILFASGAAAQKAQPAPVATAQKTPTVLWKVIDKNGKSAYMLGSIHLGKKEFFPFPAEVEDAFNNSNKLLVELDIGKIDQMAMQKLVLENGVYPGEETLLKYLSPAAQEKLKKVAAEYGIPYTNITKLRPWLVALTVGVAAFTKSGYQMEYGVDKYFLDRARGKKQIVEIESADWQIKLFANMTNEQQIKYLEDSLNQAERFTEYAQRLVAAWQSGDPKLLETLFTSDSQANAEFQKKIIDDRNPRMADFTEQCIKNDEKCFVVVGGAHIVGAKGMAQILKDRGYKVEQVFAAANKK